MITVADKKRDCTYMSKNGECAKNKKVVCPKHCRDYYRRMYKEAVDAKKGCPSVPAGWS